MAVESRLRSVTNCVASCLVCDISVAVTLRIQRAACDPLGSYDYKNKRDNPSLRDIYKGDEQRLASLPVSTLSVRTFFKSGRNGKQVDSDCDRSRSSTYHSVTFVSQWNRIRVFIQEALANGFRESRLL
jgi:hypothetical protein